MKHTPGPWSVATLSHGIVIRTQKTKPTKYGANRYACIGGFERSDPEQLKEAIANAHLIAAAPDLLDALEGAVIAITTFRNVCKFPNDVAILLDVVQKGAMVAIAKATGEK